MDLDGHYDPDNIFAKIIDGRMPSAKVFEDADTLAFMDAFPQGLGHTLVVHKASQARNLLDASPEELRLLIATVQTVTRAVRRAMKPDGVTVMQFNGAAAGQTIAHLHFHIIPRWNGTPLGRHVGGMADVAQLQALAGKIAAEI